MGGFLCRGCQMIKATYIDHMGGDESIARAARVSFAKSPENYKPSENARLIQFLARERHYTPFQHTAITLRCSAPVPIRTQSFKSKVGFSENEESRRYISSEPEVFIPDEFRSAVKDKKQGSGERHPDNDDLMHEYIVDARYMIAKYVSLIEREVCPEQARFWLPQGVMVSWIWTGSLLAYARFYGLRTTPDAQKEIRDLAIQVGDIMKGLYPTSWEALTKEVN